MLLSILTAVILFKEVSAQAESSYNTKSLQIENQITYLYSEQQRKTKIMEVIGLLHYSFSSLALLILGPNTHRKDMEDKH